MFKKSANDIVVIAAKRTPITKSIKGGLSRLFPEEILYQVVKGTVSDSQVDLNLIDDVLVGTVLQTLGGQKASALAIKKIGSQLRPRLIRSIVNVLVLLKRLLIKQVVCVVGRINLLLLLE